MKKKIFSGVLMFTVAVVTALNVNLNLTSKKEIPLFALANIEALAGENDGPSFIEMKDNADNPQTCKLQVRIDLGGGKFDYKKVDGLVNACEKNLGSTCKAFSCKQI